MKKFKVGLIIPYDKDRGFLYEAIKSANDQVYNGNRIEVFLIKIYGPGRSCSANINAGVKIAKDLKCDFVKYFAEDDLLTPNCIADSVQFMVNNDCDFLHGKAVDFFPVSGRQVERVPALKTFDIRSFLKFLENRTNCVHGLTQFWKMEVFDAIGKFDTSLRTAEEHEFTLRALHAGFKIGYLDKILGRYRRHVGQKSLGHGVDQAARTAAVKSIHNKYRQLCQGSETTKTL